MKAVMNIVKKDTKLFFHLQHDKRDVFHECIEAGWFQEQDVKILIFRNGILYDKASIRTGKDTSLFYGFKKVTKTSHELKELKKKYPFNLPLKEQRKILGEVYVQYFYSSITKIFASDLRKKDIVEIEIEEITKTSKKWYKSADEFLAAWSDERNK